MGYDDIWRRIAMTEWSAMKDFHLTEEEIAFIDSEFERYVSTIRQCVNVQSASECLDALGNFEGFIAKLAYQYGEKFPPKYFKLIRRYDRHDVDFVRVAMFKAIKEGAFP